MTDGFIPPHGGYAQLLSHRKAEIVYDATVRFCKRFLHERDRTREQMIQADYRDFLRTRNLTLWPKDSKEALYVRKMGRETDVSYETYRPFIESRPPEVVANIMICLIHPTNYLLDQQIRCLEKDFLEQGGLRERMTRARLAERDRQRKNPGR